MKILLYSFVTLVLISNSLFGQGILLVDQQATNVVRNSARPMDSLTEPFGQSFTPTFNTVDTVVLNFYDPSRNTASAAYLVLHSGSITGPTIGTTTIESFSAGFDGLGSFHFQTPVALATGNKYFFQVYNATGSSYAFYDVGNIYSGGDFYSEGLISKNDDLWFQEGITIVPEPSALWLSVAGAGGMVFWRKRLGKRA